MEQSVSVSGATPAGSGCQPSASAATASSQSGIPSAHAMADLLVARLQARLSMRRQMPGEVNEQIALELETMVGALEQCALDALAEEWLV